MRNFEQKHRLLQLLISRPFVTERWFDDLCYCDRIWSITAIWFIDDDAVHIEALFLFFKGFGPSQPFTDDDTAHWSSLCFLNTANSILSMAAVWFTCNADNQELDIPLWEILNRNTDYSNCWSLAHSLQSDDLMICAIVIGFGPSQPSDS
jgi:Ser/Thr protein kinase RdoA (MazF antagonist)